MSIVFYQFVDASSFLLTHWDRLFATMWFSCVAFKTGAAISQSGSKEKSGSL